MFGTQEESEVCWHCQGRPPSFSRYLKDCGRWMGMEGGGIYGQSSHVQKAQRSKSVVCTSRKMSVVQSGGTRVRGGGPGSEGMVEMTRNEAGQAGHSLAPQRKAGPLLCHALWGTEDSRSVRKTSCVSMKLTLQCGTTEGLVCHHAGQCRG